MSNFIPTKHPVIPVPTQAQAKALGADKLVGLLEDREKLIAAEVNDPWRYGYVPPHWKSAARQLEEIDELLILGGNRSGKSEFCGRRVIEIMLAKPGARVWCYQTTGPNSIEMQQPIVYKYIPREFKGLKKNKVANISYTQKGGFTMATFILPNGSQCWFRNYEQRLDAAEGGEVDFIWLDELAGLDLISTLRFRLSTRADTHEMSGKLVLSFTPITGYNATVKSYLDGARMLEDGTAPLIGPKFRVPVRQQCIRPNARVIYFHSIQNPYGGFESIAKTLENAPLSEVLCRAYGVPTKSIGDRFPRFKDEIHIIKPEDVPEEGTRYQIVDPASGRNWFAIWAIVTERSWVIYREFPAQDTYYKGIGELGPWAEVDSKKLDGRRGPGSESLGFGLSRYMEFFEDLEGDEDIYERLVDSRFGASANLALDRPTTLLEELSSLGYDFIPTPGLNIDEGIELINEGLDYDPSMDLGLNNEPKLYISEECKNLIFGLKTWTGKDGKEGACKDQIDCLRYFCSSSPIYAEEGIFAGKGGGSY
jgi:hypothetical protein